MDLYFKGDGRSAVNFQNSATQAKVGCECGVERACGRVCMCTGGLLYSSTDRPRAIS
jgi:hypothetical protein